MSLPDRLRWRACAVLLALVATLTLASCNVRPLYGTNVAGDSLHAELRGIDVAPVQGRVGQQVRNELLFLLNGGNPSSSEYVVDLSVQESYSNIIVRRLGGQPQGRTVNVQGAFRLRQAGVEEPLFSGRVTRHAAYERSNQRFANDRAEIDAENRAAREVAEEMRIRLAAFFATNRGLAPQSSPSIAPALEDLTTLPGDRAPLEIDEMIEGPGAADLPGIN